MKNNFDNLKVLFRDRTFRTLVLAGILITIMGSSRPEKSRGMYPSAYWARKGGWEKCADMVLAGDSRVLTGLSPNVMQKYFPDKRIYNYGFGAAWFSEKYLERVKELLDPVSRDKTIIIGISPHALLKQDAETGQFFEVNSMSDRDRFIEMYLGGLTLFFGPLSFKDAIDGIFPSLAESHVEKTFFTDGWIAVHRDTDTTKRSLRNYKMYYEDRKADPDTIENIIRFVEGCVRQGIKMYGFIPPTCSKMYELESTMSGLDEQEFIRRFESAGGVWIYVEPVKYHSFDGSHLQDDSAIQFTRDLCKKMIQMNDEIKRDGYLSRRDKL